MEDKTTTTIVDISAKDNGKYITPIIIPMIKSGGIFSNLILIDFLF